MTTKLHCYMEAWAAIWRCRSGSSREYLCKRPHIMQRCCRVIWLHIWSAYRHALGGAQATALHSICVHLWSCSYSAPQEGAYIGWRPGGRGDILPGYLELFVWRVQVASGSLIATALGPPPAEKVRSLPWSDWADALLSMLSFPQSGGGTIYSRFKAGPAAASRTRSVSPACNSATIRGSYTVAGIRRPGNSGRRGSPTASTCKHGHHPRGSSVKGLSHSLAW